MHEDRPADIMEKVFKENPDKQFTKEDFEKYGISNTRYRNGMHALSIRGIVYKNAEGKYQYNKYQREM